MCATTRRLVLWAGLMMLSLGVYSQVVETQQVIADIIEDLSAQAEAEQDYSELTEQLQLLSDNPLNINKIARDQLKGQLQNLLFLNDFQIESLLDYRDSIETIYSIFELQAVPGFDIVDMKRLQPFVTFEPVKEVSIKHILRGRHQLAMRYRTMLETPAGYRDSYTGTKYLGDKNSYFLRYQYRGGRHLELGLTAEKDPGEPIFDGSFKTGVDYLSGYVNIKDLKWLKQLVLGSFKVGFGQGLTFWNGLTFGKSSNLLGVDKRANGIKPHASAYESQYLQGLGATLGFGRVEASVFGSYRPIDAGLADTLDSGDLAFTTLPETGYHRTPHEIANRNSLTEWVLGANAQYNFQRVRLGLTYAHTQIDGSFSGRPAIYELNAKPSVKDVLGFDFRANVLKHSLFGEVAVDLSSGAMAAVTGGLFRLSNLVQMSVVGRSYSKRFNTRYSAGFAEGSTANENGLYLGLSLLPMIGWKLSAYMDLFKFPWLRFGVNSPSHGREFMLLSEHSLGPNLSGHIRYRLKQKEGNLSEASGPITPVVMKTTQNLRLQLNYAPSQRLSLKTTLNGTAYSTDSARLEMGYLLTQDLGYTLGPLPLTIKLRFAIFDTPSWNTRIYSYESDMLYSFSVPAYYSKGSRFFVMLKYSPAKWCDIYLRFAQSYFSQLEELGSGADLIAGHTRSEIKAMVRFRF